LQFPGAEPVNQPLPMNLAGLRLGEEATVTCMHAQTSNPLARKLSAFADLSTLDTAYLDCIVSDVRLHKAGHTLIGQGDRPEMVFLLVEGWACRYKDLRDGSRQIMAFLIPGDLCDINIFILNQMDHGIALLSDARVAAISKGEMEALLKERHDLARALFWATLVDEAVLREWLANIGQRDAFERVAHLFCELWVRLNQVGLVTADRFSLPLTQEQLGQTMGLTPVHVNRVLQRMRAENLITLEAKHLTILNCERMKRVAGFSPNYLHLVRRD
jgi:CRP-like cAMP-binding protein